MTLNTFMNVVMIMELEELLGTDKPREDTVLPLILDMEKCSEEQDFETANEILSLIKDELEKPEGYIPARDKHIIKDLYRMITSDSIRLNPDHYPTASFITLLRNLYARKSELQGARYIDIDRHRKIVAEEMVNIKMTIPRKKRGMGKMPNRRFLDIAFQVNPSISGGELIRREGVNLWNAIPKKNSTEIETIKQKIKTLKEM